MTTATQWTVTRTKAQRVTYWVCARTFSANRKKAALVSFDQARRYADGWTEAALRQGRRETFNPCPIR